MKTMDEDSSGGAAALREARGRTMALLADLPDELLTVPYRENVNPLLWEAGHVGWFQEYWIARRFLGEAPLDPANDALYDSAKVAHADRWHLPLPGRSGTTAYLERTLERALAGLGRRPLGAGARYFHALALFHEDMHDEALLYTRQFLAYPPPAFARASGAPEQREGMVEPLLGDAEIPGGEMRLGAAPGDGFAFDNEKWGHRVTVAPFRIARSAVRAGEYRRFVEGGGYRRRELWSADGWAWRVAHGAEHPIYWRRGAHGWERRLFDRWVAVRDMEPVVHVCWHEAQAYCRWAGRRLPTEAEWEFAASMTPDGEKRRYPWGDQLPTSAHANLDQRRGDVIRAGELAAGESPWGCRQMIGNVWEWTAGAFEPYPGYVTDAYAEYSRPWFGTHKVLRGGAWTTRARLIRNTWRNFYLPHRADVAAGFRTCAAETEAT
ncbi:MAG TPA: selenoneine synthase SenA [Candidatus Dormibacteraeota bacterium]|nr:selenoneine synthase SenA [Candidatus Dormibacteraeota bacterium]